MKKIRAAVVGYGNIGHYALEALEAARDFEVAGIVRRQGDKDKPLTLTPYEVVDDIAKLKNVDVAILATPTRSCPEYAERIVAKGINTVDSFDIHTSILDYRTKQMENCKKAGKVSVIAAGWDPGSDSVVRVLMESLAPKGISYTNFGPGMSMGHSVCVRSKEGECTFCNHSVGRRYSPSYGICRIGRWRKARRCNESHQGRPLLCTRRNSRVRRSKRGRLARHGARCTSYP